MKWVSEYKHPKDVKFEIEYDHVADAYYFYAIGVQEEDNYDGMQDTIEFAKEEALEFYGVPIDSWYQIG